jgi:hypothetical protein
MQHSDKQQGNPPPKQQQTQFEKHGANTLIDLGALPRNHLLPEAQAAEALDVAAGTLSIWRSTGRYNLVFVKVGRKVRYRVGDLLDFIERRTRLAGSTE